MKLQPNKREIVTVQAKICGLNSLNTITAAVEGGADYIGLVFYPPSPRSVTIHQANELTAGVPERVTKVGLFVNINNKNLSQIINKVSLDLLQLHGSETPERVYEIKVKTGMPVMKAIHIAEEDDLFQINEFTEVADKILFDAKPPSSMKNALPGGNSLSFDWNLFSQLNWRKEWMLSGGLSTKNVSNAVITTGATSVDVSSGVESKPGIKDLTLISAFLDTVRFLP